MSILGAMKLTLAVGKEESIARNTPLHFTFRKSNPDILKFMAALNISGEFSKLESIYIHKLLDIVGSLPTRNGYIIWQVRIIKETMISYVFQLSIMFCF